MAGDEIETNADDGYYEEAFVEPGVPRREYEALIEAFAGRSLRELGRRSEGPRGSRRGVRRGRAARSWSIRCRG